MKYIMEFILKNYHFNILIINSISFLLLIDLKIEIILMMIMIMMSLRVMMSLVMLIMEMVNKKILYLMLMKEDEGVFMQLLNVGILKIIKYYLYSSFFLTHLHLNQFKYHFLPNYY